MYTAHGGRKPNKVTIVVYLNKHVNFDIIFKLTTNSATSSVWQSKSVYCKPSWWLDMLK